MHLVKKFKIISYVNDKSINNNVDLYYHLVAVHTKVLYCPTSWMLKYTKIIWNCTICIYKNIDIKLINMNKNLKIYNSLKLITN